MIIHGDARSIEIPINDWSNTVVVTDPPWSNMQEGMYPGMTDRPDDVFRDVIARFTEARTVVVVLGSVFADPRMLRHVTQPFRCVRWLRRATPSYRGCTLDESDVAYVFGPNEPPPDARVAPTTAMETRSYKRDDHPSPRSVKHTSWLLRWFTRPTDTIIDPFAGSGTIIEAAHRVGRRFIAIEQNADYIQSMRTREQTLYSLFSAPTKEDDDGDA